MANIRRAYWPAASIVVIRVAAACSETEGAGLIADRDASSAVEPAPTPTSDANVVVPSFCNGIVLYASFDTAATAERGGGEARAVGAAKSVPSGRFGGGLGLLAEVSNDEGAALYFVRPGGGEPVFPENEGSLAMWMRGNISDGQPIFYRPLSNLPPETLTSAGLSLATTAGRFGLVNAQPGVPTEFVHAFPVAAVRPYLRPDDFNHFVTSWRRGDAAGPSAYLTINGGQGQNFAIDAAADATDPYADAGPTEAGTLAVPYRGYSSTKWDFDGSAVALRLGASNLVNVPNATIDDTAVWDRVLSQDEIAAVYRASVPIREACQLR